jgi:outer membrane protein insertion porin family
VSLSMRMTGPKKGSLKRGIWLATSAGLALTLAGGSALAQLASGAASQPAASAVAPAQPERIIQHIVVSGAQRIEPGTVLTYVNIREGDPYDAATVDQALKTLNNTGLFSDVRTSFDGSTLYVRVTENPIINQVVFEGNGKVSDKDLTKEVQIKPRSVYTRAKVQADVQRIVELYRRAGKFAATVDPQIIQRPQNRVDLIFSIHDGPTTSVSRIRFIGNKVFDDDTLRGQIATEESAWYKFFSSNDNYDPDRLAFDREQLRRFYINHGYADFHVRSAVAQLTPDRKSFYITFTVDEGVRYRIRDITITSKIKDLPESALRPLLTVARGDIYSQDDVQKSVDAVTNAAGTKGYAFAEVHPHLQRNPDHTITVAMDIAEGPRVYIEKINITGNTRTLDKVIRRQFRLVEGDAFNRVLIDRSRTRIRALGFFKDVDIKNVPGSQSDRTNLEVAVTEQSTGSLSVGLGYSSQTSLTGEFSYTELNLFGRGQYMKASISVSDVQKEYQFSFTEPWFLDRPLAAGFDVYKSVYAYDQTTYESDTTAGVLRLNFPISEYSDVGLAYTYKIENLKPFTNAPLEIALAAGTQQGSIIGFSYSYNSLDDNRRPTKGAAFSVSQNFAGFGGSLKYMQTQTVFSMYHPFFGDSVIGSFSGTAGYITGYAGALLPINERFFKGGDSFRGFKVAGIGPRDLAAPKDQGAIGGDAFVIGTVQARLPSLLPESYGITTSLFTDFGTLGKVDNITTRSCTIASCIRDNMAFRASAGISIGWKSPFGPINIDMGIPFVKESYDRPQIIHFSTATGL